MEATQHQRQHGETTSTPEATATKAIHNGRSAVNKTIGELQRWLLEAKQRLPSVWAHTVAGCGMTLQISALATDNIEERNHGMQDGPQVMDQTSGVKPNGSRLPTVLPTVRPGRMARSSSEACAHQMTFDGDSRIMEQVKRKTAKQTATHVGFQANTANTGSMALIGGYGNNPTIHLQPASPTQTTCSKSSPSTPSESPQCESPSLSSVIIGNKSTWEKNPYMEHSTSSMHDNLMPSRPVNASQLTGSTDGQIQYTKMTKSDASYGLNSPLKRQGAIRVSPPGRPLPSPLDTSNTNRLVITPQKNMALKSGNNTEAPLLRSWNVTPNAFSEDGSPICEELSKDRRDYSHQTQTLDSFGNGHLSAALLPPSNPLHSTWNDVQNPKISNVTVNSVAYSNAIEWQQYMASTDGTTANLSQFLTEPHIQSGSGSEDNAEPADTVTEENHQQQFSSSVTTSTSSEQSSNQRPPSNGPLHLLTNSDIHQLLSLTNIRETELAHRLLTEYRQALLQQQSLLHTNSVSTPNLTASQELQMISSSTAAEEIEDVDFEQVGTEYQKLEEEKHECQTAKTRDSGDQTKDEETERSPVSEKQENHQRQQKRSSKQASKIITSSSANQFPVTDRSNVTVKHEANSLDSPDYVNAAAFQESQRGCDGIPLSMSSSTDMESNDTFRILSSMETAALSRAFGHPESSTDGVCTSVDWTRSLDPQHGSTENSVVTHGEENWTIQSASALGHHQVDVVTNSRPNEISSTQSPTKPDQSPISTLFSNNTHVAGRFKYVAKFGQKIAAGMPATRLPNGEYENMENLTDEQVRQIQHGCEITINHNPHVENGLTNSESCIDLSVQACSTNLLANRGCPGSVSTLAYCPSSPLASPSSNVRSSITLSTSSSSSRSPYSSTSESHSDLDRSEPLSAHYNVDKQSEHEPFDYHSQAIQCFRRSPMFSSNRHRVAYQMTPEVTCRSFPRRSIKKLSRETEPHRSNHFSNPIISAKFSDVKRRCCQCHEGVREMKLIKSSSLRMNQPPINDFSNVPDLPLTKQRACSFDPTSNAIISRAGNVQPHYFSQDNAKAQSRDIRKFRLPNNHIRQVKPRFKKPLHTCSHVECLSYSDDDATGTGYCLSDNERLSSVENIRIATSPTDKQYLSSSSSFSFSTSSLDAPLEDRCIRCARHYHTHKKWYFQPVKVSAQHIKRDQRGGSHEPKISKECPAGHSNPRFDHMYEIRSSAHRKIPLNRPMRLYDFTHSSEHKAKNTEKEKLTERVGSQEVTKSHSRFKRPIVKLSKEMELPQNLSQKPLSLPINSREYRHHHHRHHRHRDHCDFDKRSKHTDQMIRAVRPTLPKENISNPELSSQAEKNLTDGTLSVSKLSPQASASRDSPTKPPRPKDLSLFSRRPFGNQQRNILKPKESPHTTYDSLQGEDSLPKQTNRPQTNGHDCHPPINQDSSGSIKFNSDSRPTVRSRLQQSPDIISQSKVIRRTPITNITKTSPDEDIDVLKIRRPTKTNGPDSYKLHSSHSPDEINRRNPVKSNSPLSPKTGSRRTSDSVGQRPSVNFRQSPIIQGRMIPSTPSPSSSGMVYTTSMMLSPTSVPDSLPMRTPPVTSNHARQMDFTEFLTKSGSGIPPGKFMTANSDHSVVRSGSLDPTELLANHSTADSSSHLGDNESHTLSLNPNKGYRKRPISVFIRNSSPKQSGVHC